MIRANDLPQILELNPAALVFAAAIRPPIDVVDRATADAIRVESSCNSRGAATAPPKRDETAMKTAAQKPGVTASPMRPAAS
jgi:hypothetical protein